MFTSDKQLEKYIEDIADCGEERLYDRLGDWEADDSNYYAYLRGLGYADEDGDIDWDEVYKNGDNYLNYNQDALIFNDKVTKALRVDASEIRDFLTQGIYLENVGQAYPTSEVDILPRIIAFLLSDQFRANEYDGGIPEFIRNYVRMRKEKDHYKVYVL